MKYPMVYLEFGGWGLANGENGVWVDPGWYEVRDELRAEVVDMFILKDDAEYWDGVTPVNSITHHWSDEGIVFVPVRT